MIKILLSIVLILSVKVLTAQIGENDSSLTDSLTINWKGTDEYVLVNESMNDCLNSQLKSASSVDSIMGPVVRETVKERKWLKAAILPTALITTGIVTMAVPEQTLLSKYTIQENALKLFPGIDTPIDNYLQFVPGVAVFGLKAAGVNSRNDFLNQSIILLKAEFLMSVVVQSMKTFIRIERPDMIGMNTMPSGHTAQAFLSATILDMEYRDASPWISVGGYAVAATTAVGRVVNNRHWVSDVLIGAGIGIFSAKLVYLTHQNRWGKKSNTVFVPMILPKGAGAALAIQF